MNRPRRNRPIPPLPIAANSDYVEAQYRRYLTDASSVSSDWQNLFAEYQPQPAPQPGAAVDDQVEQEPGEVRPAVAGECLDEVSAFKQSAVLRLINAYRVRGHQRADIDPIGAMKRDDAPDLDPAFHHLDSSDMQRDFHTGSLFAPDILPLHDIYARINKTYCGSIGAEYMHIVGTDKKRWIQQRLESNLGQGDFAADRKLRILERLVAAEGLEHYLHSRYVGQKRFSLEGGESLVPLLDELIQHSGAIGVEEIVLGMAHRGRLNVLVNIMGKSPAALFEEFEGRKQHRSGSGDVKYHLGFSSDINTPGGNLHLALSFNPSHLEVINPVVIGAVKARQLRRNDTRHEQVVPVLIHGDSAFSGQGVVMETLNMSLARGFHTGGTIHIVINNQIGFTTSNPLDARSTPYCTEVAKMVEAPIMHVNGDDPEAALFAINLAIDYRMRFKRDVVIDLVCYRRHGHSEADEPSVTQPLMYDSIRQRPTTLEIYAAKLISEGIVDNQGFESMREDYRTRMDHGEVVARDIQQKVVNPYSVDWSCYRDKDEDRVIDTSASLERIRHLSDALLELPPGFSLHPRVAQIMESRRKMAAGALDINWGFAETMAYATLIEDGYCIRLSGQDSSRGTFFHRHAVVHDQNTGASYCPLQSIPERPSCFQVVDSLLSEEAVLGFELGYATAEPDTLTIWEAQFGDFANGAQVFIDQFISSAETKWDRLTGLVMFLPHGFEGQGPEHSSARLERYLQLCAEGNMLVCVPSTPAQIFHLLRLQMLQPFRRPLVVMSPKSMLRNRLSTSTLDELAECCFRKIIPETEDHDPAAIERIVLCTGKVYSDLLRARQERQLDNVVLIRVEQLYPFPRQLLISTLAEYPAARSVVWCQEEPMNQGAWYQIRHHLEACIGRQHALQYAGRPASAAPAAGTYHTHITQQHELVDAALTLNHESVASIRKASAN